MRKLVAALITRCAAAALLSLGVVCWMIGSPLIDFGEDDPTLRSAGIGLVVVACIRLMYLALLEQDHKFSEGHRRGFHLGRRTTRPTVVHLPQHAEHRSVDTVSGRRTS